MRIVEAGRRRVLHDIRVETGRFPVPVDFDLARLDGSGALPCQTLVAALLGAEQRRG